MAHLRDTRLVTNAPVSLVNQISACGHASIRTTSDRYGHLYDPARDRLRDHLDDTCFRAAAATVTTTAQ